MKNSSLLILFLLIYFSDFAQVKLPKIFADNMVLQRKQIIPLWGWASANEKITAKFNRQEKNTRAGKDGKWMIHFDPEEAGGPFQLSIKGKNEINISNILVGDVWICSGQSNMEMPIAGWGMVKNYKEEIEAANFPEIRQFEVPNTVKSEPAADLGGGDWKVCSPQTAGAFTAAGYFFAREIYKKLHIPIGLINTTWGGTHVETWTSRGAFEKSDEFRTMISGMPALNIEALAKEHKDLLRKKIEELQGQLENPPNTEQWKTSSWDDSHWPHMKLPGLWEEQHLGLDDLDGVVWFRRTVMVADGEAGKPAVLTIAKIDDSDETFVNGVLVGETKNKYAEKRVYAIHEGILKPGKNVIAVKVEDTGGGGGIYGDANEMGLSIDNKMQSLARDWSFKIESARPVDAGIGPNSYPSLLFNAMVHPLVPYAIKGVIWYQGEANAPRAFQYRKAFPLIIADWRQQWGQGDFPFLFVQLASYHENDGNSEKGSSWAELREAQAMTLSLPNTGMAVTTDIGEPNDIHPKNKQDVGKRLAAIALNKVYGEQTEFSGPVYQSMKSEPGKLIISFTHVTGGLVARDKYGYVKGFEIAGADKKFRFAKAVIEGDHLIVFGDGVENPVAVRYDWADDASEGNLYNKDGFPAAPFRTDQWKGITENEKFEIRN